MKRTSEQLDSLLHRQHPILSSQKKIQLKHLLMLRYQETFPRNVRVRLLPGLFASALVTVLLVSGVIRISNHASSLQSISSDLDHMVIEEESFL